MSFFKTSIGITKPVEVKPCLTPDAVFHIHIEDKSVTCKVDLPMTLNLDEDQAKQLEDRIHDAMESVLSNYFSSPNELDEVAEPTGDSV